MALKYVFTVRGFSVRQVSNKDGSRIPSASLVTWFCLFPCLPSTQSYHNEGQHRHQHQWNVSCTADFENSFT